MSQPTPSRPSTEILALHREFLMPAVAPYYREPLVVASARGCRVTDIEGREHLDFFGGILTVSVGHADPRVNAAAAAQMEKVVHTSSLYPVEAVVRLAETLARIAPGRLQQTIFLPSGTDADDTAVVLAQVATGRLEFIALRHGYSGRSLLAHSVTGHAPWRAVPSQVAGVKHALAPYCYRCPLNLRYPDCKVQCARDLDELIRTTTTGRVAAFLAEPVLGVGGFITPPPEYFEIAVGIVRKAGGLFICDEVQTGFGRLGRHLFGIEHWGVEPDLLTMGKGIANGFPLAAAIATPEVAGAFSKLTISTFGGNPVSCAAANATIAILEGEDLPGNAERMGTRLLEGLRGIQGSFGATVGEVRGKGLMLGVELVANERTGDRTPAPAAVAAVMEEARRRGLLIGRGGHYGNVLRIAPPLSVTASEVDDALAILRDAFAAAGAA